MLSEPVRIQRKRSKGWKMPLNTTYVGRPTKWGNTYSVKMHGLDTALFLYRNNIDLDMLRLIKAELKGKNLACYCKLDKPCHADILLDMANS